MQHVFARGKGHDAIPLPGHEALEEAVQSFHPVEDIDLAISRHSAAFARYLLAHDEIFPIPIIHTVTAWSASEI